MIVKRINDWARSHPSDIAVVCNGRALTYAEFARSIERTRTFFEGENVPAGKTAIIIQSLGIQTWLAVMALRALGVDTLCIQSPEQIDSLKPRELACIVNCEPGALGFGGRYEHDVQVLVVPEALVSNVRSEDPVPDLNYARQFGGHILLTSGTTGTYKKVLLDGKSEDRRNAARARAYSLTKTVVYHAINLGLWTTIGFRMPSAVWHVGGCVVIDYRPTVFSSFFRHLVNFSILTPPMLKQLVDATAIGPIRRNCELLVTSGFLPVDLANAAMDRLTKNIGISYGSTELATPALLSRSCIDSELYWLATLDRKIRIVDGNGDDCAHGREGELCISLQEIDCASYLDDDGTSARVFRNGFFCPGDMAVSRADGRVRVLGRTSDVLHIEGNKVAVAPYELAIQRALKVDEVCVFSGLNRVGMNELVVAIESDPVFSQSSLDQITRAFPAFERVRFAYFKEFPRVGAGTGKIARTVLRDWVFGDVPSRGENC